MKFPSELTELLILMLSDSYKSIIIVKDDGKSIDVAKVAVILMARESLNRIVVVGESTGKLDQGKIVLRNINL